MSRSRRKKPDPPAHTGDPKRGHAQARRRMVLVLAGATLLLAGLALALWRSRAPTGIPRLRENVLLITLDTTRADHLGAYGYARARTRHLDRLAAEGVRFERAFSPAPLTLPAHASILTGLYPPRHGVRNNGNFYLSERFETLATVLRKRGYRTAAFISSFILDRRYGLARGFETYDDHLEGPQSQVIFLEAERRGDRTALGLARWLEAYAASPAAPFFVWLHLYDPHEPYRPPSPFREAFADAPYDGEIAFDDAVVASVLDTLGRLGLLDHTLVAVIGDHGESLGDHGEETHSMFVYDGAIRVPLILWRPGILPAGLVVPDCVRATDLAPTLLDLLGAPGFETEDGRSLVPVLEGKKAASLPPVYAETFLPKFYMNWAPLRAVRDERWKLIEAPRPELYDLLHDPGEGQNLFAERPEQVRALRRALEQITKGSEGAMNVGGLDREAMEKLAALGYVGAGAAPAAAASDRVLADPKDVIAIFNRLRQANSAVRDRRFGDALPILKDVLADDPRNAFAHIVLGSALMGMDEYAKAIEHYRAYLALVPTSAYAHQWISIAYLRMGRLDEALRESDATLAIDPRFADARVLRGGILATRGAYDQAIAELQAAVNIDPGKAMLRSDLARILAEAGRDDEAKAEYEAILRLQPDHAQALEGLGLLEAQRGDLDSAARLLRRAVEASPRTKQDAVRFELARVLERQGRRAEAAQEYRIVSDAAEAASDLRAAARERLSHMNR